MAGGVLRTRATARGLDAALALIAVLFAALGLLEVAVTAGPSRSSFVVVLLTPVLAWIYCAAGLVAWRRRPSNRLGLLLVLGAATWLGAGLTGAAETALVAVGLVLATSPLAVVVHVVHAFPSGELRGASRPIVVVGYVVALGMQAPLYLFASAPAPYDALVLADRPEVVTVATWVQSISGALIMVATTVVLVQRLRATAPSRRRVLAPLLGYGVVAVLMVPFASHVIGPLLHLDGDAIGAVQMAALAGIPVAFVLGLLRGGFGRTGEIQELGAWLGSGPGARPALTQALADTLGDPTLELWFWVPDRGQYVDGDGRVVTPATGGQRGLVEVELGGERIGAIVYDAALLADPEPVRGAGRVVALALERDRLTAELLGTREALRHTLARVVESADQERRRIARDLHDGLQSRLVLLGVEAYEIETDPAAAPSVSQAARRLRAGLDEGAGELRRLVHGVLPAALIERGLYAAAQELVAQLPIRATVTFPCGVGVRLPAAVESAAYFVITESVTNTLKHAEAHEVRVGMELSEGVLRLAVTDDGVGGAVVDSASGLAGLVDRVAALGGRIDLDSPPGGGTTLRMEVPCVPS